MHSTGNLIKLAWRSRRIIDTDRQCTLVGKLFLKLLLLLVPGPDLMGYCAKETIAKVTASSGCAE